jgi:hypothetical protein
VKVNLASGIALNDIYEAIKDLPNIFGIDRDVGSGVLHLDGTKRFLSRDRIILSYLKVEFLAWVKIHPCQATRVKLVGVSPKRSNRPSVRITPRRIGKALSLIERLRHGLKQD